MLARIPSLVMAVLLAIAGCGALPPLPGPRAPDGGAWDGGRDETGASPDGAVGTLDAGGPGLDLAAMPSVDGSATRALDGPGTPALDGPRGTSIDAPPIDAPGVLVCPAGFADCNGDSRDGCETAIDTTVHCGGCATACGTVANGTAACVSGKCTVKCAASFGDCDGKYDNGCETALDTPSHCGSCTNACAAVANGSPTCTGGTCTVKCTAPYQDCDGKYDNGCEIPVGQANSCDRNGLAAFSGAKPPCGTPYCGSGTASNGVQNFGSWYCSFCDHCTIFSDGGSYCLYASDTGNFSGVRCASCCAANSPQVCGRQ